MNLYKYIIIYIHVIAAEVNFVMTHLDTWHCNFTDEYIVDLLMDFFGSSNKPNKTGVLVLTICEFICFFVCVYNGSNSCT